VKVSCLKPKAPNLRPGIMLQLGKSIQHEFNIQKLRIHKKVKKVKGKAIPVTGHEGPQGCEASRLPHFV
jgi:hypothetical protein